VIHRQILDSVVQHDGNKAEVFDCQPSANRWTDGKDKCFTGGIFETLHDSDVAKLVGVAG
jgi:hypothetical protein